MSVAVEKRTLDELPYGAKFRAYGREWIVLGPDASGCGIPCCRIHLADEYESPNCLFWLYPKDMVEPIA